VHEAGTAAVAIGPAIKIDSLDERTGTVAHSDDGDSDFAHFEIVKGEKLPELDLFGARYKLGNFNLNSCASLAAAPSVAKRRMCPKSRPLARTDIRGTLTGNPGVRKALVRRYTKWV
jgi:hypothetical protein